MLLGRASKMEPKKILITGAGGFIGSQLCKYFAASNYKVIAYGAELTELMHSQIEFFVGRLPATQFHDLLQQKQPEYLIHCAGGSSVTKSFLNPKKDFHDNVVVTEFLFDSLVRYSPATKVIFLSSGAVYGEPTTFPITEQTLCHPISPYGYNKLLCELICDKYYKLYKISVSILRLFSIYGAGLKKQILWDFCCKAMNSSTIIMHGSGDEVRDFLHVDDLSRIIDRVLTKNKFTAEILNIASGESINVKMLAEILRKKNKFTGKIAFNNRQRTGDPIKWVVDAGFINYLGIKKLISLEMGISSYVAWFLANR
jgi:nucleoside-diphosphate-sugar epimerase